MTSLSILQTVFHDNLLLYVTEQFVITFHCSWNNNNSAVQFWTHVSLACSTLNTQLSSCTVPSTLYTSLYSSPTLCHLYLILSNMFPAFLTCFPFAQCIIFLYTIPYTAGFILTLYSLEWLLWLCSHCRHITMSCSLMRKKWPGLGSHLAQWFLSQAMKAPKNSGQ